VSVFTTLWLGRDRRSLLAETCMNALTATALAGADAPTSREIFDADGLLAFDTASETFDQRNKGVSPTA
jgi:hypothetical protein